jgi:peroxiredoxin
MKKITLLTFILAIISQFSSFAQIADKAEDISPLLYGETLPGATLIAPDGSTHQLSEMISMKPTVLIFYRGGWCPYCNAHLKEIRNAETEIVDLDYQILAISPDSPENLIQTTNETKPNYTLFSDGDGKLTKAIGIAFKASDRYADMLDKRSNGLNDGFLPVPSVFVTDTSGTILFEYINPDYKTRLSAGLLLAVLKELNIK